MKIDRDYVLVASDDELNIYRRLDKQQKYNKQHAEDYKRTSVERHKRAELQKKSEFYDNRSINYRKHIRW